MIESSLLPRIAGFVDGEWTGVSAQGTFSVLNPANGDLLAEVPKMGVAETEAAIQAADLAWKRGFPPEERRRWLLDFDLAFKQRREELARIITLEHGKTLRDSLAEVDYAAGFFRYYADQIEALQPTRLACTSRGAKWEVFHRPAGVAASITPWNFPLAMFGKKLAPALAAGCGVVAKPSGETPLTAIAVYTLAAEIGVPAGQMNLVMGPSGPIGELLCQHPLVRVISCTSSTETGRILLRNAADHIKRLSLELGGNAPFVVCEDADLEAATTALLANKFRGSGQTCVCANRVFVHQRVLPAFLEQVVEKVKNLRVGDGLDPNTDVGPLINRAGFDKVAEHVHDALGLGGQRVFGQDPARPDHNWGAYYPPTVISQCREGMKVFSEETFGPLVAVASFASDEEAVSRCNDTEFGLAAYVFTRDEARGLRMISQLRFGHVGLNSGVGPTPEAPFGGMKQSGFGREGGLEGLFEFVEPQTVASSL